MAISILAGMLAVMLLPAAEVFAQSQTQPQTQSQSQPQAPGGMSAPATKNLYRGLTYDPKTETKISGVVEDVQDFECPLSAALGNHLLLKTGSSIMVVHVAPAKFIKQYGLILRKGDRLEVTGSLLKDNYGHSTMIAREIARDDVTFIFRTKDGKPGW